MIKTFRHRDSKALYEGDRAAKVAPAHIAKLLRILTILDRRGGPDGVDLPEIQLHPLRGALRGHHAVSVSGNWRVTFRFEDGHTADVDYLNYH